MQLDDKVNILLVDDREENLVALEATLSYLDQRMVRATSGLEALRLVLRDDFAVILLDVHMPSLDGFETAALIREREKSQTIPIIFLTAMHKSEAQVFRGYSLGAVDYIFKPFEPEILKAKVSVFIDLYKKTEEIKRQAELLREANRDQEEKNRAVVALYEEIERKNQELFKERDFISAVLDTAGSLVVVIDDQDRIVRFNRACEQISGYRFDEVVGRRLEDLFLIAEEVEAVTSVFERVKAGEYPIESENFWVTREGASRIISWTTTALQKEDGSVDFIIRTGIDVTEQKRVQEALRRAKEDLEIRVQDRTRELASSNQALKAEVQERKRIEEERLDLLLSEQDARRLAEEANRAKDEFLATVSHELRTPLNAVLGWARLLRTNQLDEETVARALETIERNAKSQAQLVEDILDVSRIITGKMRLEIQPVEIVPIIEMAVDAIGPAAEGKAIQLELSLDPSIGQVACDPDRLQQVVWNLVSNAVKFTPVGGQVRVILDRVDSRFRIIVTDTGEGISEDLLPFVFDRFRQAEGSLVRRHGGLGLGLAIVRHLVEMHGGTVRAESKGLGKGATFTIELPMTAADDTDQPEEAERQPESASPIDATVEKVTQELDNLRILVVEDDNDTRAMLEHVLTRSGADVRATASAAEALEELCSWNPDLLLSDLGMPDEDGYSLIGKVRSLEADQGGNVPAIALTAFASARDREMVLSAGFQMHVTKPVDPAELITIIADLTRQENRASI